MECSGRHGIYQKSLWLSGPPTPHRFSLEPRRLHYGDPQPGRVGSRSSLRISLCPRPPALERRDRCADQSHRDPLGHARRTVAVGGGRASDGAGWYQQLRQWWTARRAARQRATLAAINSCWDSQRETIRPLGADAAPEMAAAQGALSMAILLYGFTR